MTIQASTSAIKPFFRFPFDDRQSKERFWIGTGLIFAGFIIPIIPGLFVYGYVLRIIRSTSQGEVPSMAAWDDWSGMLSLGFRGAIVNLVFTLPALIVFMFGYAAYFGSFLLLPLSSSSDPKAAAASVLAMFAGMGTLFISLAIGSILLMLGLIPLPASVSHFVAKDQISAAFRVREWWRILSRNWLGYFISFVIVAGILGLTYFGLLALYYTIILACLAVLITIPITFYTMLVGGALFGEAYRQGVESLRQPLVDGGDTAQ
jgi:hypothetical protein